MNVQSEAKLASKKSNDIQAAAKKSLKSYEQKQNVVDHRIKVRAKDNRLAILVTAATFVVALVAQYSYFGFGPGVAKDFCINFTQTAPPAVDGTPKPLLIPDASISECREWTGVMTVNKSNLDIKLDGEAAPQAVANFIDLIRNGFYTGITCHRLTTSGIYVLQCGDPKGDGSGDPGYKFGPIENAPVAKEGEQPLYKKGVLAMARQSNGPTTMGSQFFIVYEDSTIPSDAAGGYTVFGEVTAGLSGLDPIIEAGVKGGSGDGNPKIQTTINNITIN
jgi:peptidyl-prolyl cis-trans isomerase B (cyclophilin B)